MSSSKIKDVLDEGLSPVIQIFTDEGYNNSVISFPSNAPETYSNFKSIEGSDESVINGFSSYVNNFCNSDSNAMNILKNAVKDGYVFYRVTDEDGNEVYTRYDNGSYINPLTGKTCHDIRTGIFADLRGGKTYYASTLPKNTSYAGTYNLTWAALKAVTCDSYEALNHSDCNYFVSGHCLAYRYQYISMPLGYLFNIETGVKLNDYDSTKDTDDGFFANGRLILTINKAFCFYNKITSCIVNFTDGTSQTFSDDLGTYKVSLLFDSALLVSDISVVVVATGAAMYEGTSMLADASTGSGLTNSSTNKWLVAKPDSEEAGRHLAWSYFITDMEGISTDLGGWLAYKYGYVSDELGYTLTLISANLSNSSTASPWGSVTTSITVSSSGTMSPSTVSAGISEFHIRVNEKLRDFIGISSYTITYRDFVYTITSNNAIPASYTTSYPAKTKTLSKSFDSPVSGFDWAIGKCPLESSNDKVSFASLQITLAFTFPTHGNIDIPIGIQNLDNVFKARVSYTSATSNYPYGYGSINSNDVLCVRAKVKEVTATNTANVYQVVLGYDEGYVLPKVAEVINGYCSTESSTSSTEIPSVTSVQTIESDTIPYVNDYVTIQSKVGFQRIAYNGGYKDFMYFYDTDSTVPNTPKVIKLKRGESYIGIMNSQHAFDTWNDENTYVDKSLYLSATNGDEKFFSPSEIKSAYGYGDDTGLDIWVNGTLQEPISELNDEELVGATYPFENSFYYFNVQGNITGYFVVYDKPSIYSANQLNTLLNDSVFDIYTLSAVPTFDTDNDVFSFSEDTTFSIAINSPYSSAYYIWNICLYTDSDSLSTLMASNATSNDLSTTCMSVIFGEDDMPSVTIPSGIQITYLRIQLKKKNT